MTSRLLPHQTVLADVGIDPRRTRFRVRWLLHGFRRGPQSDSHGHVSSGPPTIPDGRFSRVRFWPRLCTPFSGSRSSQAVKGSSDGTRTPPTSIVHLPPRSDPGPPRTPSTASGCGPSRRNRRVPRAPLPAGGVTRDGAASRAASGDVTPPSKLVRAHAPVPPPLIAFGLPYASSLRRLLPSPAGRGTFPTLSPGSLRRRLDPYPAVPPRCIHPFLPWGRRPHVTGNTFGTREYPCDATSTWSRISGLQSFADVQSPPLARPPDRTHRGARGHRAAGPFTPRIARRVSPAGMWHRYVTDLGNCHGWTHTSWIPVLSAAPSRTRLARIHSASGMHRSPSLAQGPVPISVERISSGVGLSQADLYNFLQGREFGRGPSLHQRYQASSLLDAPRVKRLDWHRSPQAPCC